MASEIDGIGDQVRRADPVRFAAALFAPAPARPALLAIAAFNLELARAPEAAREPLIASMRLAWWREALDGVFEGRPRRHPVVEALAEAIRRHGLPRAPFDAAIEAREVEAERGRFADWAAFDAFADATAGSLIALSAAALGRPASAPLVAAAARAQVLAGHLRAAAWRGGLGLPVLPEDLMARRGAQSARFASACWPEPEAAAAREAIAEARVRLRDFAGAWRAARGQAFPAFAPLAAARGQLNIIESGLADRPPPSPDVERASMQGAMLWAWLTGRF